MSEKSKKTVRHRKVIRDSVQGITKPALKRICRRAGVKRISGSMYEEMRGVMKVFMENILKTSIIFMEHSRRKTLLIEDLDISMESQNVYLGVAKNPNTDKTFESSKAKKKAPKEESKNGNKTHRFKPGTVALREIRYYQAKSDTLLIPRLNFSRLSREIGQDYVDDLRYSAEYLEMFQVVVEDYMTNMMKCANLCALHDGDRVTIMPKDLQLARRIRHIGAHYDDK